MTPSTETRLPALQGPATVRLPGAVSAGLRRVFGRRRAGAAACLLVLAAFGCGTSESDRRSEFAAPNSLMHDEIQRRIEQIPYMHKEQLLDNLLWLAGQGEQVMPQLFVALGHQEPKVRSSAAWCLGWIGDKRSIQPLQDLAEREGDEVVRLEVARQLLVLGDLGRVSQLIAGLESDRRHVRYLCYEALKSQTGQDFGYDHRVEDANERAPAVARWRTWWSEMQNDRMLRTARPTQSGTTSGTTRGAGTPAAPGPGDSGAQRTNGTPAQSPQNTPNSSGTNVPGNNTGTNSGSNTGSNTGNNTGVSHPVGTEPTRNPGTSTGTPGTTTVGNPNTGTTPGSGTNPSGTNPSVPGSTGTQTPQTQPTSRPTESAEFEFK